MTIKYSAQDIDISSNVTFRIAEFGDIEFQFPPKMLSDNRKGSWSESMVPGTEPVAVYETSGAREFGLSWTYIVDNHSTPSGLIDSGARFPGPWSITRINNQLQKLRGYFSLIRPLDPEAEDRELGDDVLIVNFAYPFLTGPRPWSCRLRSVDVKHGETLVGSGNNIFPLRTDVTVDLRLWTTGVPEYSEEFKEVQNVEGMLSEPSPEDLWY